MSNRRSIVWLLFLVVLAAAVHLMLTLRARQTGSVVQSRHLANGADRAVRIGFVRSDGEKAVLVRSDVWRLEEPFRSAVDQGTVLRVADTLAFASVSDVLTESEMHRLGRGLSDFGFDRPSLRIDLEADARETSVTFGDRTPAGDGVYAVSEGVRCVYVIPTNVFAEIDVPVEALRLRKMLLRPVDRVKTVDIRRSVGKFIRVGLTDGAWRMTEPQAAPASAARVSALLDSLASARVARFVWPTTADRSAAQALSAAFLAGYGLDAESAVTVTLKEADGTATAVSFGKQAEPGLVYALVQNGGAIAVVDKKTTDRIFAEADSLADLRLFPYDESAVSTVSVRDGNVTYLVTRAADGAWRIDSPLSASADSDSVRSLIADILSLNSNALDPNGLQISVASNTAPVGVSRDAVLVQHRLEDLRSKTMLKLPAERIRQISVSADGRQSTANWDAEKRTWFLTSPKGGELDGLALAGVLKALDPLEASSVVRLQVAASEAGNYGLENPHIKVAVDPIGEEAVRRNILIGAESPQGGFYATVGSADAVFVLPAAAVRALTVPFVTAPATPAP